jgi:hypothetical protein
VACTGGGGIGPDLGCATRPLGFGWGPASAQTPPDPIVSASGQPPQSPSSCAPRSPCATCPGVGRHIALLSLRRGSALASGAPSPGWSRLPRRWPQRSGLLGGSRTIWARILRRISRVMRYGSSNSVSCFEPSVGNRKIGSISSCPRNLRYPELICLWKRCSPQFVDFFSRSQSILRFARYPPSKR